MKQPFLIRIFTWFAALASAGMFLSILLAFWNIGPSVMGGERVTRTEWLHIAAPLVAVIGVLMTLTAFGFAAQKHWSRHVVIAMFGLIIVYASTLGALDVLRQRSGATRGDRHRTRFCNRTTRIAFAIARRKSTLGLHHIAG